MNLPLIHHIHCLWVDFQKLFFAKLNGDVLHTHLLVVKSLMHLVLNSLTDVFIFE